jgi:hypothetical protein
MAPIDDAIAAFESQEPGEKLTLQACADEYGVERSTLGQRIRGRTRPIEAKATSQQKLNSRQEMELVEYIGDLTKRGLPPTREMIQNFASEVALGWTPTATLLTHTQSTSSTLISYTTR